MRARNGQRRDTGIFNVATNPPQELSAYLVVTHGRTKAKPNSIAGVFETGGPLCAHTHDDGYNVAGGAENGSVDDEMMKILMQT